MCVYVCVCCREDFHDVEKRTLQERVERLLKSFRTEQMQGMRRSGTEEEYDERERLLQDLSDLEREWGGRKREAAPSTAADQRKKAAKLHAAGQPMLQRLAAPLRPRATATATVEDAGPAAQQDAREAVEEAAANDPPPAAAVNNPPPGHEDNRPPQRKSFGPAARCDSTLNFMQEKFAKKKEENKTTALDLQREELQLKKDELAVRKLEVANELKRIEALEAEQKRRAEMEEERRKEEREERKQMMEKQNAERKEMMDRQGKLMDAMLQLLQAKNK